MVIVFWVLEGLVVVDSVLLKFMFVVVVVVIV